jgi:TolA-binding protein
MAKKVLFVALILAGFAFFEAKVCFADAAALVEQAESYYKVRRYEKAKQVYESILNQYDGTDYAFTAQKGLTILYIASKKQPEAEAAFQELIASFFNHGHIVYAVHDIANQYREFEQHEEADRLYQYVVANWPDSKQAMWSQMRVVMSNITGGNDTKAKAALDKLTADFSKDSRLPTPLYWIAITYEDDRGKYEEANDVYRHIIQNWPDEPRAREAQLRLKIPKKQIVAHLEAGNDSEVLSAVDKLITDFGTHPDLPSVISHEIAERYYKQAFELESQNHTDQSRDYFRNAIGVWGKVMEKFPESTVVPTACYFSALCYHQLGEHEKAHSCCKRIVDKWPDCKWARWARVMVEHRARDLHMPEGR